MEHQISFVTTNPYKFAVAKEALTQSSVQLIQCLLPFEVPEIQSTHVEAIASFSAKWVCEKIQRSIVLTDAGYYIEALNGFPGPFIKYINEWLSAEDILRMMEGKVNRAIEVRETLAYCEVGKEPVLFTGTAKGRIALQKGKKQNAINEIFIPEGFYLTSSDLGAASMQKFWAEKIFIWQSFSQYLQKKE